MTSPASASCAELPSTRDAIEEAKAVFVGTVVEVENARRWVQVDVQDVWKGEAGERVEVRAGPADPPGPLMSASSVDRTYKLGETYLFVLWNEGSPFQDDACSATTRYGPRVAKFDPTLDVETPPIMRDLVDPGEEGVAGETIARWVVVAFSLIVFLLAMTRNVND